MKQAYDLDEILFRLFNSSTQLKSAISGGIYLGQRPDNSEKEDIVISTISITQEYSPQIATSNINIHVSDLLQSVAGKQMRFENRIKIKSISEIVLNLIRESKFEDLTVYLESQNVIREPIIFQSYSNIRLNWLVRN